MAYSFEAYQLGLAFLSKHGVCWGEFRVADFAQIFKMKNTSPARAYYIAQHIEDLIDDKYQTFIIIFVRSREEHSSVMEQDKDYRIHYKSVNLDLVGDCYVHNITKGIFMIEGDFNNEILYEFYKLSNHGLNNFANGHKNRCFSKTIWFDVYLRGNVFIEHQSVKESRRKFIHQNRLIRQLQEVMINKHYKEVGFNFNDLLNFLKKKANQSSNS